MTLHKNPIYIQRRIDYILKENNNVYMYLTKLHPEKIDFPISGAIIATQSIDALLRSLVLLLILFACLKILRVKSRILYMAVNDWSYSAVEVPEQSINA